MNKYLFFLFILFFIPFLSQAEVYSANFNGASTQYFYHADNAFLRVADGYTLEFWIKTTSTSDYIIRKYFSGNDFAVYLENDGSIEIAYGTPTYVDSSVIVNDGAWHHIAVYFNGANSKLYHNGVFAETLNLTGFGTPNVNFGIGASPDSEASPFTGKLDDLRVWSVERTEAQIDANNNCELTGAEANLNAYWRFENNALDETANNLDLTAVNTPTYVTDVPSVSGTCSGESAGVTATSTPEQDHYELLSATWVLITFLAVIWLIVKLII